MPGQCHPYQDIGQLQENNTRAIEKGEDLHPNPVTYQPADKVKAVEDSKTAASMSSPETDLVTGIHFQTLHK